MIGAMNRQAQLAISVHLAARANPGHDHSLCGGVHGEDDSPAAYTGGTPSGFPGERLGVFEGVVCEKVKPIPHPFLVPTVEPSEVGRGGTMKPNVVGHAGLQTQLPLQFVKRHIIAARDFRFCPLHVEPLFIRKRVIFVGEQPPNIVQYFDRAVLIEGAHQLDKLFFRSGHDFDSHPRPSRIVHTTVREE